MPIATCICTICCSAKVYGNPRHFKECSSLQQCKTVRVTPLLYRDSRLVMSHPHCVHAHNIMTQMCEQLCHGLVQALKVDKSLRLLSLLCHRPVLSTQKCMQDLFILQGRCRRYKTKTVFKLQAQHSPSVCGSAIKISLKALQILLANIVHDAT